MLPRHWIEAVVRETVRGLVERAGAMSPRERQRATHSGRYQVEGLERRLFLSSAIAAFGAQQTFATGTNPYAVTVADVNGDGRTDLVLANTFGNTLSVLLGNGNGTFQSQQTLASGTFPTAVAVSDVNGDGRLDIAAANASSNNVSIFLGNGNGSFQPRQTFAAASGPDAISIADLNADGKPDLIVANQTGNTAGVLLGNGNGTFQAQKTYTTGTNPASVMVSDVNGDGKPDLLVAAGSAVSVLLGNGSGGFPPQQTFASGTGKWISVSDLNTDGKADLIVANENSNTVSILMGNGNATFSARQTLATGSVAASVAASDVNGDGIPDLVVTNAGSNTLGVFLGNGNGTFQAQQTFAAGTEPVCVAIADVNGDGRADLIAADDAASGAASVLLGDVPPVVQSISRTNPAGTSTSAGSVSYTVTFNEPVTGVDATDFALALSGVNATTPVVVSGSGAVYTVTVNGISGAGTLGLNLVDDGSIKDATGNPLQPGGAPAFQAQQTFATGSFPSSVAVSDVNRDGRPDLLVANSSSSAVSVLLGTSNGIFQAQQTFDSGPPASLAVSDVNGDGRPDLIVANYGPNTVSVLLGNANLTFQARQTFAAGTNPRSVAVSDLNGDGKPDLAVADENGNSVSALLGNGNGTFQAPQTFASGGSPWSIAAADLNGDGKPDLLAANVSSNTVSVLLSNGNGTFQAQQTVYSLGPYSVAVSDVNGDGSPDLLVANLAAPGAATVLLGNGNGTFRNRQTFAAVPSAASIAVSDTNGDGRPDLVVAGRQTASVSVLAGNGNGTFQSQQTFATGSGSISAAVSDINGDGRPDLVVANRYNNTVSVLMDSSNGNFTGQTYTITPPVVTSISRSVPSSPITSSVNVTFAVTFSRSVSGVTSSSFVASASGSVGFSSVLIISGSGANYTVTANNVHGNGILQLELVDNDAIVDGTNIPLGGAGAGNGSFIGQSYTILQPFPTVLSINRTNPAGPSTGATSVTYTVTFSTAVTGVVPADFSLALNGVNATTPVAVSGSGAVYTVTINGISGNGTLGLNLVDHGAIHDLLGNPLQLGNNTSFTQQQTFAAGANPTSLASLDVNGDGKPDLVVTNFSTNRVGILLGNGLGMFQLQSTFATGPGPYALSLSDVNGDGKTDLIIADKTLSGSVTVLLGNGDGTYQAAQTFAAGAYPRAVTVADVNGDGRTDVIVANSGGNTLSVLLGNGNGTFQAQQTYATGPTPAGVATSDFNGDGIADLVATNKDAFPLSTVSVLLGNGNGTFQAQHTFGTQPEPTAIAVSDFNADGSFDLVATNGAVKSLSVLLGNGNGAFPTVTGPVTINSPDAVTAADVNGDGLSDIVLASYGGNTMSVFLGNGDGTFQPEHTFAAGSNPASVAFSDFNADRESDVAVANSIGNNVSVFLGNGTGNFTGQVYTILVNFTGGGDGTSWTDPNNWSIHQVPDPTANAIISLSDNRTIQLTSGSQTINSLVCTDPLNISGGTLIATAGAQFSSNVILAGGTIRNTALTFSGGGKIVGTFINVSTPAGFLDGDTVNGDIDLTQGPDGTNIVVTNGLTINGTIHIGPHGVLDSLGNQTIATTGGGTISLETTSSTQRGIGWDGTGTLTLGTGMLVHGSGMIGIAFFAGGNYALVNDGTISADVPGQTMTISINVGAAAGSTVSLTNLGTLQAINGSTLNVNVTDYTNQGTVQNTGGGVVNVSASGTVTNSGGNSVIDGTVSTPSISISGGNTSFVGTSPISIQNLTLSGGTLDGPAPLTVTSTATLTGGSMAGTGTTTIASGAVANVNGDVTATRAFQNLGTVNVSTGTLALNGGGMQSGGFNVSLGANLSVGGSAAQTFAAGSAVTGSGTIQFVAGSPATVEGTYNIGFTEIEQQSQTTFASSANTTSLLLAGGTLLVGGSAQGGAAPLINPASTTATILTSGTIVCAGGQFAILPGDSAQITSLEFLGGTNVINLSSDNTSPASLALAGDVTLSGGTAAIQSTGIGGKIGAVDLGGVQRSFTIGGDPSQIEMSVTSQIVNGSVRMAGSGRLQLTNLSNSFNGLALAGGVLEADTAGALGVGPLTFQGGGLSSGGNPLTLTSAVFAPPSDTISIDVGGSTVQVPNLTLGSSLTVNGTGTLVVNGPVTLQADVNVHNAANLTISGVISGNFSITKDMAGTMTLQGSSPNTYTGATSINQGTLLLNKPANVIAVPSAGLAINGPATVQLSAFGQIASSASLSLNSVSGPAVFNLNNQSQSISSLMCTGVGGSAASILLGGGQLAIAGTLTINGGSLVVPQTGQIALSGLSITGGGSLDIQNNPRLLLSYSGGDPISLIRGYLLTGYNNGAWNGSGIISANAANNAARTTAIGYADSADGLIAGQAPNTIELKYTLYGDTTLTASVGFNDFTRLTQHYNQTSGGAWDTGDFNYDGSVNSADFTLLSRTYNTNLGSQAMPATASSSSSSTTASPASNPPTVQTESPTPTSRHAAQPRRPRKHPA